MTEKKQEFIGRKITSRMKPEALAASGITELIGLGNGVLAGGLTFGLYRIFSTMPQEHAHLIEGGYFSAALPSELTGKLRF